MSWNFDMIEAPRGRYETRTHMQAGKEVEKEVFIPEKFIAAGKEPGHVTVSWYIPEKKHYDTGIVWPARWAFFAKGEEPIAWQQWPTHPHGED